MRSKVKVVLIVLLVFLGVMFASAHVQAQKAHDPVSIQILAMRFGTLVYAGSFGMAELLKKHSTWLKAEAVEARGGTNNVKVLAERPAKRKNTITATSIHAKSWAEMGKPPFNAPYKGLRGLFLGFPVVGALVTLDPKIKTGADLVGKRLGLATKGTTSALLPEIIITHGFGVWDKLKAVQWLGYKGAFDGLRGGTLDVALFNNIRLGNRGIAAPANKEFIESVRAFYPISYSPEDLKRAREKTGMAIYPATMPKGALGPKQTYAYHGHLETVGWWAAKELPDDIAYEICRIVYENYKEFWGYHAGLKGINPETMARIVPKEEDYHPGALKFYKEKGVKIGLE